MARLLDDPRAAGTEPEGDTHILTHEGALALFDEQAQRYLGMTGREFVRAWHAGAFRDDDRPEVMRVAMLLPLADEFERAA